MTTRERTTDVQLCTFTVGHLLCGVSVLDVQEVLRERELTTVPLASRSVRGLLNLRGEVVTAIDLRSRLGLPDRDADESSAHVIIRSDDEDPVSLLVDAVEDVVTLAASSLEPPPQTLIEPARTYISGVHQLEGRLLLVLDAKAIVAPEGM